MFKERDLDKKPVVPFLQVCNDPRSLKLFELAQNLINVRAFPIMNHDERVATFKKCLASFRGKLGRHIEIYKSKTQ